MFKLLFCSLWRLWRDRDFAPQFRIAGEQGRSASPDLYRLVGVPVLLELVAEPKVGSRKMRLRWLRLLLLNERLELFDYFRSPVHLSWPMV
jgi:hypothetical protein